MWEDPEGLLVKGPGGRAAEGSGACPALPLAKFFVYIFQKLLHAVSIHQRCVSNVCVYKDTETGTRMSLSPPEGRKVIL